MLLELLRVPLTRAEGPAVNSPARKGGESQESVVRGPKDRHSGCVAPSALDPNTTPNPGLTGRAYALPALSGLAHTTDTISSNLLTAGYVTVGPWPFPLRPSQPGPRSINPFQVIRGRFCALPQRATVIKVLPDLVGVSDLLFAISPAIEQLRIDGLKIDCEITLG